MPVFKRIWVDESMWTWPMKSFQCSSVKRVHRRAMGFSLWWLTLVGALLGQVITWLNIFVWLAWSGLGNINELVQRAVKTAVQECLDLDISTTSTTTEPVPFIPTIHWYSASLSIWVRFDFVVIIVGVTSLLFWLVIGWWWCTRSSKSPCSVVEPGSPLPLELPIAQVARNQLAEIRLRRHGPHR